MTVIHLGLVQCTVTGAFIKHTSQWGRSLKSQLMYKMYYIRKLFITKHVVSFVCICAHSTHVHNFQTYNTDLHP
jgi:hypothetical protein